MIRVGLIGIGFMGWIHYLAYQRSSSARLAAFASREAEKRAGDSGGIQGNFGPPGGRINVADLKPCSVLSELLQDSELEVIDICLPPFLHVDVILACLKAGKHVFCEKPLGLTTEDCDRVLAAAEQFGKKVFVAHVLPFVGPFQFAFNAAMSGQYGKVRGGYFKRIISNPDWIPDFYDRDRIGGPMVDLHVHDTHFILSLFGIPKRVTAHGPTRDGVAKFAQTVYAFEDPTIAVSSSCGVIDQAGRGFTHGFELYLESATIQFEYAALQGGDETMALKVMTSDGKVLRPDLPDVDEIDPFVFEIEAMATAIEQNGSIKVLDCQTARDAIHLALGIERSVLEHRPVDI